jgi:ubiquinone/menaquinone biosynthesis C-methylase UbiE
MTTSGEFDPRIDVDAQYMGGSFNKAIRFNTYRHADDGRDLDEEMMVGLDLNPESAVLDIGSAEGKFLSKIGEKYQVGKLIGLDIDREIFDTRKKDGDSPLEFVTGNATSLPFEKNTVDLIFARYVLYHARDIALALAECQRVLKPDGKIIVATSGDYNKLRQRQFETKVADYCGAEPPPRFAEPFYTDKARVLIGNQFDILPGDEGEVSQLTKMRFSHDSIIEYILAFRTMHNTFNPIPRNLTEAFNAVVQPVIDRDLEETGFFTDIIDRTYFVAVQKPDQTS